MADRPSSAGGGAGRVTSPVAGAGAGTSPVAGAGAGPPPGAGRPAAFLDRDGTIIEETEYLADPAGIVLVPGAIDAIRRLREGGLAVVLVTNQSGIARGLYRESDYRAVARRLEELLADAGAAPDGTYYCPHHPDFTGPCDCRKPGTGMYLRAARELGLDLGASYYVGDKATDVEPARTLGGEGILVRTGYGGEAGSLVTAAVTVVEDLPRAADHILRSRGGGGPASG